MGFVIVVLVVAGGLAIRLFSGDGERHTPKPPVKDAYPAEILDLTNWKLTLPVDGDDDEENADEVRQPCLARACYDPSRDQYSNPAYRKPYTDEFFYVNKQRNGVVFRAPVAGATTSGSENVRSELRELAPAAENGDEVEARWSNKGPAVHTMVVEEAVMSTPERYPSVVMAQIHDDDDDVMLIKLRGNRLFADADSGDFDETLDDHYKLGTKFKLTMVATQGEIRVTYNDKKTVVYQKESDSLYFKAGVYNQSNLEKYSDENPKSVGEVVIYSLQVTHEGGPAAPPADEDDSDDDD